MNNNFKYAKLTESQLIFLVDYTPANRHFTSNEEVDKVAEVLNLKSFTDTEDMRAVRNSVVRFYSKIQKNEMVIDENGDISNLTSKFDDYQQAMMSVTAVIDHFMYKINRYSV